jgi:hypothetical protein
MDFSIAQDYVKSVAKKEGEVSPSLPRYPRITPVVLLESWHSGAVPILRMFLLYDGTGYDVIILCFIERKRTLQEARR